VIQDRARAVEEGGGVARHALDLDGRGLVIARGTAALAGGGAAETVAVDFPGDPAVDAVVVAGGIDDAAGRGVADQRRVARCEGADGGIGGCEADAMTSSGLTAGVVHYIDAVVLFIC